MLCVDRILQKNTHPKVSEAFEIAQYYGMATCFGNFGVFFFLDQLLCYVCFVEEVARRLISKLIFGGTTVVVAYK